MPRNTDPMATSVWTRPPRPQRGQPTLSRDQIVSAAIELLDADGLDGLSMRRLGAKLAAGATSAYWYVANKDELLELAIDEIMEEVEVPDPHAVGWRAAAGGFARGFRSMILRHSWAIGIIGTRPALGPNAMRMSDRAVAVLTVAGFSGAELSHASSLLLCHALGSATTSAALRAATTEVGKSASDLVAQVTPYLDRVAPDYPSVGAYWSANKGNDLGRLQEDGFDFGLERLLDGLETWLDRVR